MNKSLKESDRLDDPNVIHLAQPSYLKEVNNELTTKYNKQREFVSLAAHELRCPILPILGTLELIEYEFEESGKLVLDLVDDHKRQIQKSNVSTKLLYEFNIEEEIPTRQDDFSPDIYEND